MTSINYKDSVVSKNDPGNIDILGRESSKTEQFGLFCTIQNVSWAADRVLKRGSFPLASISFQANRSVFKYQPGDLFILNYEPYNISNMVFRLIKKSEDSIESEKINIIAVEDIDYISENISQNINSITDIDSKTNVVEDLVHVEAMEAPYILSGDEIKLVTFAAKEKGNEKGYSVYYSTDNITYSNLGSFSNYSLHGTLSSDYTGDTFEIDDLEGIYVDFGNQNVSLIETCERTDMIAARKNLAILNDELITFQSIIPVSGTIYKLLGIYRGRWDTEKIDHLIGEDFYWLGSRDRFKIFTDTTFVPVNTRYVKIVPYNDNYAGSESEATVIEVSVSGRALKPYIPISFAANGKFRNAFYSTDIILTWKGRLRNKGAGSGDADTILDEVPTWEGQFELEVWVSEVLVRTITGIDFLTFNYDQETNISDNGTLPSSVTFKLKNYRVVDEIKYSSSQIEIIVTKES